MTVCLTMSVNPIVFLYVCLSVCLYTTAGLVMDFLKTYVGNFLYHMLLITGFGCLEVACWPLVPKFVGSNPAEAVGFFGRKNPQCGGEVKPSVPCRKFTACKRTQK